MPFRPHIKDLKPYVAQAPVERLRAELGLERIYKLASNEGAFGPLEAARLAVFGADPDELRRYPDSAAPELRAAIAVRYGLTAENVVLGNGADELIRLAALTVLENGDNGVYPWPSFPTYVAACASTGAEARPVPLSADRSVDLDALRAAVYASTRIVYVANPNNPTGLLAPRADLRAFVEGLPPHVLCVLDEAYAEYAEGDDEPEGPQLVREGLPNVVVLRTFSKVYGLAGLRIGYALAAPAAAAAIDRVRGIFNVNSLAQVAALASLSASDSADQIARRVAHVKGARMQIFKWLALAGHKPIASRANFVFAEASGGSGAGVEQSLLKLGVAVRALDGFGAPEAFRVTCGNDEENQYFAAAIDRLANGFE
ncbi:MAG: histidinol-phosphate transaminase [Actinobacteria bacterium]|nr:histidinol-phosphate transaminase [Actinomycetota bacterium]